MLQGASRFSARISGSSTGVSIASMPASWARHFSPRAAVQSEAAVCSFMIPILPIECWWRENYQTRRSTRGGNGETLSSSDGDLMSFPGTAKTRCGYTRKPCQDGGTPVTKLLPNLLHYRGGLVSAKSRSCNCQQRDAR